MRRTAVTVALVASCATFAAAAFATSVPDPQDVSTGFDISRAAGIHNRVADQLVHTVDFYKPIPHPRAVKGSPPGSVCVEIWTRSTPGESPADYEACATPGTGNAWVGSIARKRAKGPQLRIGPITVQQPSDTQLVMRIDPDDIKRPASYRWRVEATDFGTDCKSSSGCPDYAPDRPDTAETKLGKPRAKAAKPA